jgi:23S rRNA (cytosine1962-C5)-methyltransferase
MRGPRPERDARAIVVRDGAASAIVRGHPWVYGKQIERGSNGLAVGDTAVLADRAGKRLGVAMIDPGSPIAARVWTTDVSRSIDEALIVERVRRAIEVRDRMLDPSTTALRWVHGEGDRAPGLVIDRYADVAVMRLDGDAMESWTDRIAEAIAPIVESRGIRTIVVRSAVRGDRDTKIRALRGPAPPDAIEVREHGVPFLVDLARGQKTGAFLDQRENRRLVGAMSKGRRVLNLFSYAGGFSLLAALGGAREVTSVDVAAGAHATAQKSFSLAGASLDPHVFVTADVWDFLERARQKKEKWDLIVSDPPSLAPNEATKPRAMSAYKKLHALCANVLADGGVLCAASCSSHVSPDDFLTTLGDDVLGRSDLRIVEVRGAGIDHPVLPAFPEGRYLKFCVLT